MNNRILLQANHGILSYLKKIKHKNANIPFVDSDLEEFYPAFPIIKFNQNIICQNTYICNSSLSKKPYYIFYLHMDLPKRNISYEIIKNAFSGKREVIKTPFDNNVIQNFHSKTKLFFTLLNDLELIFLSTLTKLL